jgi:putative addiction module component (TIGR02574 family)
MLPSDSFVEGLIMSVTMQSLGIDQLSVEERLALVQEIWDSIIDAGIRPPLSEARLEELRRRAAEDDADPDSTIPWEEVKARALGRSAP